MTRTSRMAGFGLAALSAFLVSVPLVRAQDVKPSPLDGAWTLVEQKNGTSQTYEKLPEGVEMTKFVTGGRFVWVIAQGGKVLSAAGGKCTVDKDKSKYSEIIEYALGEGNASLVGKTFDFTWKVDGNTWLHVGSIKVNNQDVKIDEKWERCK